jgi:hypothetical protein
MMTVDDESIAGESAFISDDGADIPASQKPITGGPATVTPESVEDALGKHAEGVVPEAEQQIAPDPGGDGKGLTTVEETLSSDTSAALDALLKQATKPEAEVVVQPNTPAEKPAAPAAPAAPAREPDEFDKIQLPPTVSAKAGESFETVKRLARERQEALRRELEELKAKVVPPEKVITEELEKELKELRNFKTSLDYQNTDEFRTKFGEPLANNEAEIFERLKAAGIKDDGIAKIKEIGLDGLDWDGLVSSLPGNNKLVVQALVVERERLKLAAEKAASAVKMSPAEYAKQQAERVKAERDAAAKREEQEFAQSIDPYLTKERAPWFYPQEVPTDADEAKRQEIAENNKFAEEQRKIFEVFKKDKSPATHATLVAATLLALQQKRQIAKLEQRAKEAEEMVARISKSSSAARDRLATPHGAPAVKESGLFDRPEDALSRLRDEVTAAASS